MSVARRDDRHGNRVKARLPSTHRIDADPGNQVERQMTKIFALIAASVVFIPFAMAALHQAAQIVA